MIKINKTIKRINAKTRIDEVITALSYNPHGIPSSMIPYIGNGPLGEYRRAISVTNSTDKKYWFKDVKSDTVIKSALTTFSGHGKFKLLRLKANGAKALKIINPEAYDAYIKNNNYKVSDKLGVIREQSYSECILFLLSSGYETRTYKVADINMGTIKDKICDMKQPNYYITKNIERLYDNKVTYEKKDMLNKTLYSRCRGMVFYPDGMTVFPVYNCQGGMMKIENSEIRNKSSMLNVARNAGYDIGGIPSCILLGHDYENCVKTISSISSSNYIDVIVNHPNWVKEASFLFSGYKNTYCIPISPFGQDLLRIYAIKDWKNKMYDMFLGEGRCDGKSYAMDGKVNGRNVILAIDSDFNRLLKIVNKARKGEIKETVMYCFEEQKEILMKLFGPNKKYIEYATLGENGAKRLLEKLQQM